MNPSDPSSHFHLGIVTGLGFEADIVRTAIDRNPAVGGDKVTVACHGPGQERGLSAARSLLDIGATALLSFGVGGGCNPDLPTGTVIVSTGIRDMTDGRGGEVLYTNREWQRRIKALLLGTVLVEEAMIASVAEPVTGSVTKKNLFADIHAAAIDMESAAIARAAIGAGVSFMALRAILDDADTALPPAALAGMREDGTADTGAVLRSLLRRPQDISGLIGLGTASARAKRALAKSAACGAPMFGAV
jgi:adenosylhomocysteine nucleosidase